MKNAVVLFFAVWSAYAADPVLTLYNQNFAVVRESISLTLKAGSNPVRFSGVTGFLEPDSVLLRDPSGKIRLQILEQNYRADPVSLESMLAAHEGQEVEFLVERQGQTPTTVRGKIIRAGSVPAPGVPQFAYMQPNNAAYRPMMTPLIEVDGKLRFYLPGSPIFPALAPGAVLTPTLDWIIESNAAATLQAELAYLSGGFTWDADYNIVAGDGGKLDLTAWVTMENRSGKTFENAAIKLMAGDVNKLLPRADRLQGMAGGMGGGVIGGMVQGAPPITEKTFDEYHLYTLARSTTLRDRETKQVEFLRKQNIQSSLVYTYDGAKIDMQRFQYAPPEAVRQDPNYGTQSNNKVWVMREFSNTAANQLGEPLPKGRVRFYRRDGNQLEFTGEDTIQHTATGETVRVFTGAAFDLTGERKRTNFRMDHQRSTADESFEIRLRNRKKEPVEIRVVEHLYRWSSWEIYTSSQPFKKTDAQTAEVTLQLAPGEEKTLTYSVRYTW